MRFMRYLSLMCAGWLTASNIAGAGGQFVVTNAATGLVVTQFAVPVAVPQYAVPVAPASHVQYGGYGQVGSASASPPSTTAMEDRIVAKVVKALESSGRLTPQAAADTAVSRSCASCHGQVDPKAGLSLTNLAVLSADQRLRAIERTLSDDPLTRMPPASSNIKLSPEDLGKVLQELSHAPKGR